MTQKVTIVGVVIAIVIAILALVGSHGGSPLPGSSVNGGNVTDYTAVNTTAGYWVNGTKVVTSSGGLVASALAQFDSGQLSSYTNSTSTTATTQTLVAADIADYSTVLFTPNTNSVTLTLPASSTLSAFVPTAGDWAVQCWINATTTAAKTITFAAGVGIDLESGTSTLALSPGNSACLRYIRKPATSAAFDIIVQYVPFVDAD